MSNVEYKFNRDDWTRKNDINREFNDFVRKSNHAGCSLCSDEEKSKRVELYNKFRGNKNEDETRIEIGEYLLFFDNFIDFLNYDIKSLNIQHEKFLAAVQAAQETQLYGNIYVHNIKRMSLLWSVITKLRTVCDIAIILWIKLPKNRSFSRDDRKIDQLGDFLKKNGWVEQLKIKSEGKNCLSLLNEMANTLKHPSKSFDFSVVNEDVVAYIPNRNRGRGHFGKSGLDYVCQNMDDIVQGVGCFIEIICNEIEESFK